MTEREKMVAGLPYRPADAELTTLRTNARRLAREFNATTEAEPARRSALLTELFAEIGPGAEVEPTFRLDYGVNTRIGERFYANFGCVILDVAPVTIGDGVMFAPGVHVYAATHPIDPTDRLSGVELGKPVTIGNRVWVGGGTILLPGVTVGDDVTVGAGSVVTKDLPPRVVAAGNPCRVLRPIGVRDRL